MTSPNPPQASFRAIGWLLVLPAFLGALITLVLPTAQTIWLSFQSGGVLREIEYAGLANYDELLREGEIFPALMVTLSLIIVPLLVAVLVAPLLALALDRAGTWPRRAGRIVTSLAIVTFSPVGVATAWFQGVSPEASGLLALAHGLRDPVTAPAALQLIIAAATFGVVCALGVLAYLPALRGGTPLPAMIVVGVLMAIAVVAVGLQTFSIGFVLTRGGPNGSTQTLMGLQYQLAFIEVELGAGASVATLVGVLLGVLGLVATAVAVAFRTRITLIPTAGALAPGASATGGPPVSEAHAPGPHAPGPHAPGTPLSAPPAGGPPLFSPPPPTGPPTGPPAGPPGGPPAGSSGGPVAGSPLAGPPTGGPPAAGSSGAAPTPPSSRPVKTAGVVVGVSALVLFVAVGVVLTWPWISGASASPDSPAGGLQAQVNTWVPAIAGALVSVGVAYLAALGIGGLRPLGRGSDWLLLVFAPWLFVGTGPLGVANWQNVYNLGLLNSFLALVPPLLVSVPALLVLTLLCRGLAERNDRDFFGGVVLPSLPMAGILTGAVALLNAQDLLWPLLVAVKPALHTAPVAQVNQLSRFGAPGSLDVGAATPLLVIVVALLAAVAAQLFYLDRLALSTNDSRSRPPAA
ncbi:hypothetical protein [Nonomuraea sp. SYSU D8015]|uniref:hypothetical protein n=1 Tax=Nonomuraea sp. SYSU D8015 TaxID=2593644 RepID=UPI0016612ACA|nr:hypothetical protein [Nonomuraea sp. SYSU D8015]